jgi:hypothetical protein
MTHLSVIDHLSFRDWQRLVVAAALLDIEDDDHFDAHADAIHLWASPHDKPAGWPPEIPIEAHILPMARSPVATVRCLWEPAAAIQASPARWPVVLDINLTEVRGARYQADYLTWRQAGDAGRVDGDEAWCRQHWRRLKQYAEVGTYRALG